MKHPSEATLALFAGGDLGLLARWRAGRHVAHCARCRDEVTSFSEMREVTAALGAAPEVAWNRLASGMKANIRLGLAAGECVRDTRGTAAAPHPLFAGARAAVAFASALVLLVTGFVLEHPTPRAGAERQAGVVVQVTRNGIQVQDGAEALSLLHAGRIRDVTYIVGAQGSMRARYVDPDTGNVTINNVYAE
jgi:hypothetical protein